MYTQNPCKLKTQICVPDFDFHAVRSFEVLTCVEEPSALLEPNVLKNVRIRQDAARIITSVYATEVVALVA